MQEDIALSGVIGALSYVLDITEGQPAGHAVRSCTIGMRIAEELRLPSRVRSDLTARCSRRSWTRSPPAC